jgi:excisionase family DNA binding protein
MTTRDDSAAIQALEDVRSYLVDEGREELGGKVAEVISALRPDHRPPVRSLLSTGEAAALLGVRSINTIKRWASDGLLEGYRVGGRVKVTRASVETLLKSPIAEGQRKYERDLAAALDPFDAGDEPLPPTGRAHAGRKPWDTSQHAQ